MKRSVVLFINSELFGLGFHEGIIRAVIWHNVSYALQLDMHGDLLSEAFIILQEFIMRLFQVAVLGCEWVELAYSGLGTWDGSNEVPCSEAMNRTAVFTRRQLALESSGDLLLTSVEKTGLRCSLRCLRQCQLQLIESITHLITSALFGFDPCLSGHSSD